jgi:branched-chain amino acid transport system substrate-binding protein
VVSAKELVRKDITVSVGGGCSVAAVPVLKVFRDAGIPMIIPSANSTDLLAPGYDSVFLLSGTTKVEAQKAVAALANLHATRVAAVHDGTSFSGDPCLSPRSRLFANPTAGSPWPTT